jgi:serine/threonine-protein phosphatase 6 regulatory ankyrin repeat subunit A/serine/threonine-protein phosphatase 6 regulatory ankyrin repeat subunit B
MSNNKNFIHDRLIAAAVSGDKAGLEKIISADRSLVNWADKSGVTILMIASMAGTYETVEFLIKNNASMDKVDENKNSALIYAISYANADTASALIKNGANLNLRDNAGLDAAELAQLYSQKKISAMLSAGRGGAVTISKNKTLKPDGGNYIYISPERQNKNLLGGLFSLIITIIKYGFVMMLFLIAMGIYIAKNEDAVDSSHTVSEKVEKVEKVKTASGDRIFQLIQGGDLKGAIDLIDSGRVNLNSIDSSSRTALMLSAKKGYVHVVKLLLEKGADKEKIDRAGNTALFYSIESRFTGIVRLLLDGGANYSHENNEKMKPAAFAVKYGSVDILKLLIEKGADINAKDCHGDTALTWAAYMGSYDSAKLLIDSGADINVVTLHDNTPLSLARRQGHSRVAALLIEKAGGGR